MCIKGNSHFNVFDNFNALKESFHAVEVKSQAEGRQIFIREKNVHHLNPEFKMC